MSSERSFSASSVGIELAELLAGTVDVVGERADLVAVADRDALGELPAGDLGEPPADLAQRPDDKARHRVREVDPEPSGDDDECDQPVAGRSGQVAHCDDVRRHLGHSFVDHVIGQRLQLGRGRLHLFRLHGAGLVDIAGAQQRDIAVHRLGEPLVFLLQRLDVRSLFAGYRPYPREALPETLDLLCRLVDRLPRQPHRRRDQDQQVAAVVFDLAVCVDPPFGLQHRLGAPAGRGKSCKPVCAEQDQKPHRPEKGDQQL